MGKDLKGKELGKGLMQRKNGVYTGRYVDRYGHRRSVYDKVLRKCKEKLEKAIQEVAALDKVNRGHMTLSEWYIIWFDTYKEGEVRESTKVIYSGLFHLHIEPVLGKMTLLDIENLDVRRLIKLLRKKGLGYSSREKCRILLVDMFDKAIINKFVLRNPARGVKHERDENTERRVLTVQEQDLFLECSAGTFYNNMFVIQLLTGLRPGELFALEESDIHLDEMYIDVRRTIQYQKFEADTKKEYHDGPPKTDCGVRQIPIRENLLPFFHKQIKLVRMIKKKFPQGRWKDFGDLLFISTKGNPYCVQTYNDAIARIIKEINSQLPLLEQLEPVTGHTFRHTFATRCIESGVQPKTLQSYLGHATLKMTMDLYVHITDEFKREEMEKLDIKMWSKNGVQL